MSICKINASHSHKKIILLLLFVGVSAFIGVSIFSCSNVAILTLITTFQLRSLNIRYIWLFFSHQHYNKPRHWQSVKPLYDLPFNDTMVSATNIQRHAVYFVILLISMPKFCSEVLFAVGLPCSWVTTTWHSLLTTLLWLSTAACALHFRENGILILNWRDTFAIKKV